MLFGRRVKLLALLFATMLLFSALSAQAAGYGSPAPAGAAAALGSAFTYQGQLKATGGPLNGLCAFQFGLYDDPLAGNQIGQTLTRPDVPLNQGLFTVSLDFGAGAFPGAARWLQIAVKCASDSGFVGLSPRQALTPTPYALYAPQAGSANTASSVPWGGLTGSPPDTLQKRVSDACAAGSSIRAINADGTVTCQPGGGGGGLSGLKEFTANGTFTVPASVTHLLVEAWGAGGGGAGTGDGAGGGGGGYVRGVIAVTSGQTLTVVVGAAGTGGTVAAGDGNPGLPGGDSKLLDAGNAVLIVAAGGAGGGGGTATSSGRGGQGGGGNAAGGILRPGTNGDDSCGCSPGGQTAIGSLNPPGAGAVINFVVPPNSGYYFSGGAGSPAGSSQPGENGQPGYLIVQW